MDHKPIPFGANSVSASSGNVANANAVATLAAPSQGANWVTGFTITAAGATAAAVVNATLTGMVGGTMTFTFVAPAGATAQATPLIVNFATPQKATDVTAAVLTLPALGAGNTNAAVTLRGFTF